MSDKKSLKEENSEFENGNVTVSAEVISAVVKNAVSDIEGVHCLASEYNNKLMAKIAKKVKPAADSIKVYIKNKSEIYIEISVVLEFGTNVISVSEKIQEKIKDTVEDVVGMNVRDIDVTVDGIHVDDNGQ